MMAQKIFDAELTWKTYLYMLIMRGLEPEHRKSFSHSFVNISGEARVLGLLATANFARRIAERWIIGKMS